MPPVLQASRCSTGPLCPHLCHGSLPVRFKVTGERCLHLLKSDVGFCFIISSAVPHFKLFWGMMRLAAAREGAEAPSSDEFGAPDQKAGPCPPPTTIYLSLSGRQREVQGRKLPQQRMHQPPPPPPQLHLQPEQRNPSHSTGLGGIINGNKTKTGTGKRP